MATYTRQSRRSSVAWAAGSIGTPVALAAYKVSGLIAQTAANAVDNGNIIGERMTAPPVPGGRGIGVAFNCDLRGSGTADVPPIEGALLRACGFSETASGSTPAIVYKYEHDDLHLLSDTPAGDTDPIDLTISQDMLQRVATGCVGNLRVVLNAGSLARLEFAFTGNLTAATAIGSHNNMTAYTAGVLPVAVVNEACTINGVSGLVISSLVYDCGNIIDPREDISGEYGYAQPIITGCAPTIAVQVEIPLTDTIDFETLYTARTQLDFSISHDTAGGIRRHCDILFSGIIAEYPKISEVNGKYVYNLVIRHDPENSGTKFSLDWKAA